MRIISKKKISEFGNILKMKKADAAMFLCSGDIYDSNIEYLSGFRQEHLSSFSCLIVSRQKTTLIVSSLNRDQACAEAEADEIIKIRKTRLSDVLKNSLKNVKKLAINQSLFPLSMAKRVRKNFIDIGNDVLELRSIKEYKEIGIISKSCLIANKGVNFLEKELSSFRTCKELSIELGRFLLMNGADDLAFPIIPTSGKRGLYIHPYPSASKGKIENMGLIDFGVRFHGYCSDVTVPFVKGALTEKQKLILRTVKEAYSRAVESLEIGAEAHEVFNAANDVITRNGFEFKHNLGHGLGLDVHEYPNLSPKPVEKNLLKTWKQTILKENMVFTIEPGVYEKEGGFRLENDFVMTRHGPRALTKARVLEI